MSILFSDLDRLLAENFINENEINPKNAGLENPQLQITIHEKNLKEPKILKIGNNVPKSTNLYGTSSIGNIFFSLSEDNVKNVRKNLFDFRDKVVFAFERAAAKKVTLQFPNEKIVFIVKNKRYKMIEPEKIVLNNNRVDDLLWSIDRIEMNSIVHNPESNLEIYGLLNPLAVITVEKANKEIIGPLMLGKIHPDDPAKIYAKLKNQPDIFTIKKSIYDDVHVKPADLK